MSGEPTLTTPELRLVEQYLWVCDYMGRCAMAIRDGNWHYLWDKAGDLSSAAKKLEQEAGLIHKGESKVRENAVLAGVRWFGRIDRVARLLHPLKLKLDKNEVGSIVLAAGGSATMSDEALGFLSASAARVAERTDVDPETCLRVLAALVSYEVRDDG
jgi:hypothetical protein